MIIFFPCRSADYPYAAASAKFFDAAQKTAVRHHIIAFGFHHHHEITFALNVKENFGLALALVAERIQGIDGAIVRATERDSNAQRLWQGHSRFVEWDDFVGGDLRIRSLLDAHSTANENRDFK